MQGIEAKSSITTERINWSFKVDLECGFLDNEIVSDCESCCVRDICKGLDNIIEEQKKKNS